MSTLTFTPTTPVRVAAPRPTLTVAQALLDRLARSWSAWQAERALVRLDDHALHDMGLVRSEIGRAVREGRPQR